MFKRIVFGLVCFFLFLVAVLAVHIYMVTKPKKESISSCDRKDRPDTTMDESFYGTELGGSNMVSDPINPGQMEEQGFLNQGLLSSIQLLPLPPLTVEIMTTYSPILPFCLLKLAAEKRQDSQHW